MRTVMLLIVAALSVGLSGSAHAVDLVTPEIFSPGGSCCMAVNANPSVGNLKVRFRVFSLNKTLLADSGNTDAADTDGNFTIAPGHANGYCPTVHRYHYCRITTSNGPATRGNLMSFDSVTGNPTASVDAN